ncbi:MAG: hypothetical protein U9R75_10510 [Candidatus Thermoplasmatota archaeon]|nr:hypothetical protein [Candidatus Thermoplasmatota archaeon]
MFYALQPIGNITFSFLLFSSHLRMIHTLSFPGRKMPFFTNEWILNIKMIYAPKDV